MYCGGPVEKNHGKGEHIVQKAIGGAKTLKDRVCTRCNNNELSEVDRELCSLSFLSVVASQEIDGHLALVWDVDHRSKNLLIEARPVWESDYVLKHLIAYPQITFEPHGPDFRGDAEAIGGFGRENLESVLKKAALSAFQRYENHERDSIQFERCESSVLKAGYRLAPRLYAHRTIQQIAKRTDKEKFYLHYATDEDKNFALDALSKLHRQRRSQKFTEFQGSHTPTICFFFDVNKTIRGLLKMGLNLVAAVCENTPIGPDSFPEVIGVIRDSSPVTPELVARCGFVQHGNVVTCIAAPNRGHSFLITYGAGRWHVHSSFFGGRMGAYVYFPGPHKESWATMRIVAPLGSKDWTFTPSQLAQVMYPSIEHARSKLICPSLQIQNTVSELMVTLERRRLSK
jgi:hypothetical protein